MDVVSVLLGGLVGSIVGGFLAYLGARRLQDQANARRERGAARAVYDEVAAINADLIVKVQAGLPMPATSTATYDGAAADLAVFLSPRDFDVVALAYYSVHLHGRRAPAGTADPPDLPWLVDRLVAAREVLERTAFTADEMAARRALPAVDDPRRALPAVDDPRRAAGRRRD